MLPNLQDTLLEASYVDENSKLGLKDLSKRWLGYEQVDYATTTTIDGIQHKMNQLSAEHVLIMLLTTQPALQLCTGSSRHF